MMICVRGRREFHDDNDNVGKRFTMGDGLMIMIDNNETWRRM